VRGMRDSVTKCHKWEGGGRGLVKVSHDILTFQKTSLVQNFRKNVTSQRWVEGGPRQSHQMTQGGGAKIGQKSFTYNSKGP